MVLKKTKTEYKKNDKCFKDGFHLIISGIKVSKPVKKYIIQEIIKSNILEEVFEDVSFCGEMSNILDKNSAHVVTLFPGSCKRGKSPYDIYTTYKVEIKKGKVCNMALFNIGEDVNIVHEFSVNYGRDGGLITKHMVDVIEDVKFKTYGCGSAIASSTMFVEMLKGKTIEEAKQIKDKDIADALQLPPIKLHCSVLAEEAIKKAIENWEPDSMIGHNNPPENGRWNWYGEAE